MTIPGSARTATFVYLILTILLARPAAAQYRPMQIDQSADAERYHIEGSAAFWFPSADLRVSSAGSGALSGLAGSDIDAKRDLGLTDKRLPALNLVLKAGRVHKLRVQYIPITFTQTATLTRDILFNGQRYRLGLPVNSSLDWKAARFSYEFDFVNRSRGFGGFIVEAKYTDVRVDLASPFLSEFAHARAPIPALGGIGRVYVASKVSVTGELTAFKIPDSIDNRYQAHYLDFDMYGTVNVTNHVGAQLGYKSMDLGYLIKQDSGSFTLRGLYFGIVARY